MPVVIGGARRRHRVESADLVVGAAFQLVARAWWAVLSAPGVSKAGLGILGVGKHQP